MTGVGTVLLLTLKVAAAATALVVVPAVGIAYLLARHQFPGKRLVSTLAGLPLVLPPTAVGFLLLHLLAADGLLGRETLGFDLGLLLTWKGAVLAAAVMSLPIAVRTAQVAFEGVDPRLANLARTLGWSPAATFFRVTLPLAGRGLAAALVLTFTRAVGEFGATVTLAGNIPGRTQTLASAIFTAQQVGDDDQGRVLMLVALAVGFAAIWTAEWLSRDRRIGDRRRGSSRRSIP